MTIARAHHGLLMAAPNAPPVGAFPSVLAVTASQNTTASATHVIPLSAPSAGDLIIVLITLSSSGAVTPPAGTWGSDVQTQGVNTLHVFWKTATGSEGSTLTFTSADSRRRSSVAIRIASGTWSGIAVDFAPSTDSIPDPPSLNPGWGTEKILWIAAGSVPKDTVSFTAYPYASNQAAATNTAGGIGTSRPASIAVCTSENETSSENPGAFSLTGNGSSTDAVGATIAVRPV